MSMAASVVAMAAAGCASTEPNQRMESTSGAIRAAEEVGAPKVPQAALYLQLAKEQSDHAKQLIADGKQEEASSLLNRAQADAELAVALVREDNDRAAANEALERVKALRAGSK